MLDLYVKDNCAYSAAVLHMVDEYKVPVTIKNVGNNRYAIELIEKGGKFQLPCLVDTDSNIAIYESSLIMDYLGDHMRNKGVSKAH